MSKKSKINNRLDKIFKDINPEGDAQPTHGVKAAQEAATMPIPASQPVQQKVEQVAPSLKSVVKSQAPALVSNEFASVEQSVEINIPAVVEQSAAIDALAVVRQSDDINASAFSINIQTGYSNWATLRVWDENAEREWSPDEQALVKQVSDQLSLALENARLFQEAQKRADELALINRVVSTLTSATNLQDALRAVVREIVDAFPVAGGGVAMMDEDKRNLTLVAEYFKESGKFSEVGLKIPLEGNPATQAVISTHKPYILEDAANNPSNPPALQKEARRLGIEFTAIFPIVVNDAVVGTLGVNIKEKGVSLDAEQIALLEATLAPISTAISRLRAEESMRESEARYRAVSHSANDAIVTANAMGNIIDWNRGSEKIFGYTEIEAVGKPLTMIMPEQYRAGHNRGIERMRGGEELTLLGKTIELEGLRKDGSVFPLDLSISRWEIGKEQFVTGIIRDITERKKTEETLNRRNEYLAISAEIGKLVTSTLDLNSIFARTVNLINERFKFYHAGIFIVEETGFNAVVREATGVAGAEMKKNKHTLQINSKSIVGKVTGDGKSVIVNDVTADPLHKINPLLPETRAEAAIPLRIGNRVIGAIDIQSKEVGAFTEDDVAVLQTLADQVAVSIDNARSFELSQQAVMEMREIDRLKSQFLANMSHELRTPLNSIIGFSRVILKGIDGPVSELQQQDLTAIYNSGQHLLSLINDILDLSKIEAGKMELAFDEVNMTDITSSVLSTMSGLVKDKQIQLKSIIEPDLPTVRADTIRVRQVMINLLSNAAKFTDEGDIMVEVRLRPGPTGRNEVCVSVIDTGQGITPEDQAKLFQPFTQVDDSPTRKTGGTGLGLSICQHLINMHGGRIWIDSEVGKGSTFSFTLPLFRQEKISETAAGKNRVILAIDDDPQIISLYERYLQPQGYQVIALSDPKRAVERVKQVKPFAVTLDIMMPNIDGWQVLDTLKSDPETRQTPVIICSIIDDFEKGFSLGAADYLVKPILEDDIVDALDRLNADGSIREVLVIDDDPNDLRLIGKILNDDGRYKAALAEGGRKGWDLISSGSPPHAVILDLFMPDINGFEILGNMRADPKLRDIPVIVISGVDLSAEQKNQLTEFGQRLLSKGDFNEKELLTTIQRALERSQTQGQ